MESKFNFNDKEEKIYEKWEKSGAFECKKDVVLSDEHSGFEWLSYDDAMQRLTWDSNKTALYELNCRLQSMDQNAR